jgi:hypothetical protein
MNRITGIRVLLLLLTCSSTSVRAAQPDGWLSLFDGKNLRAWNCRPGAWVINGNRELTPGARGGNLYTRRRYCDFELELDSKVASGQKSNSGVFVRVHDPNDDVNTGMEIQIMDDAAYGARWDSMNANGALYDLVHPSVPASNPPGEWNHFRIVANGSLVTVELNGKQIVDADISRWSVPHRNADGTHNKFRYAIGSLPREGFIGLQSYGGSPVWYRNIRLKPLTSRKPRYTGTEPVTEVLSRLWDAEPTLRQAAQTMTVSQPVPSTDPQPVGTWAGGTAPRLNTRKMRIGLWGPPEQLTLSLNKVDVWDRRFVADPPLTVARAEQMMLEGKDPAYYYRGMNAYDFPCPKPVGQIILHCADLAGAAQPTAITRCADGTTRVSVEKGGAGLNVTYAPMMARNVIAAKVEARGLREPLWLRLYRHRDTVLYGKTMGIPGYRDPIPWRDYDYSKDKNNGPIDPPRSGTDGRIFWIRQRLPAEKTFPRGFEYVMAATIVGAPASVATVDGQRGLGTQPEQPPALLEDVRLKRENWDALPNYEPVRQATGSAATATLNAAGTQRFTVLVAVATSQDAADPLAEARRQLAAAERAGFDGLVADDAGWFGDLYDRREHGRVFYGTAEAATTAAREAFDSWQWASVGINPDPLRNESSDGACYLEQDWAPWHGLCPTDDFYFTSYNVANRSDALTFWYETVRKWLPAARQNARTVFGVPGAAITIGYLPPVKADIYVNTSGNWTFCTELPAQVAKVLWDRFDYDGDEAFLRRLAYPYLREVAIFCANYAKLGTDGWFHVIPTLEAEHWEWTWRYYRNRDSTSALSLFRWALLTAATASEILGRDADLRGRWREVAGRLAPYPTFETPEGPIYADVRDADPTKVPNYNWFAGIIPCAVADEVNLDSPPATKQMMLRSARLVSGWANWMVPQLLGVDKGFAPEQMVNSRSGRIHLFPGVPAKATVAFREMQARGGFAVSAECVGGVVTFVELTARRDGACRLMNPWPRSPIVVRDAITRQTVHCELDRSNGECCVFPTVRGHRYTVSAGG